MPIDPQVVEEWKSLHARWYVADQRARKARGEATVAAMKCTQGIGRGPTMKQFEKASELERAANMLRAEMDLHVLSVINPCAALNGEMAVESPDVEVRKERVCDAVNALFAATGTASFCIAIQGTKPTVYVAAGQPDLIRWLLPNPAKHPHV
jgi:hypothetical protein